MAQLSGFSRQQIVRMETRAMFPFLIEVTDPAGEQYLYANSDEDIVFDGRTYTASCFKVTPPEKTQDGIKDALLTISAVDQVWIAKIRSFSERSSVRFVAAIVYEDGGTKYAEAIEDITFTLTKATWTDTAIRWTMTFDEKMNVNFPATKLDSQTCPGLY